MKDSLEDLRTRLRAGKPVNVDDIDLDRNAILDSEGRPITEARAREMAAYALKQARKGRPSLTGSSHHSPRVSFRVPPELARRAEELAAQQGKSMSQLGREALKEYLDRTG